MSTLMFNDLDVILIATNFEVDKVAEAPETVNEVKEEKGLGGGGRKPHRNGRISVIQQKMRNQSETWHLQRLRQRGKINLNGSQS